MHSLILLFLLSGTLTGITATESEAAEIPDSLLSEDKARQIFYTDSDQAHDIIQAMRVGQTEPQWKLDMYEGNLYFMGRLFRRALSYHMKAYRDKAVNRDPQAKILLLRCLMDDYDFLKQKKELMETYLELDELAKKHKDATHMALAKFKRGKTKFYQGDRKEGYEMCQSAVKQMKEADYHWKNKELASFYAELTKMYMKDSLYSDALRMSMAQEQSIREDTALHVPQARLRTLRRLYAIRALLLAKMGRFEEADSTYELCKATGVKDPIVGRDLVAYLQLRAKYYDALDVLAYTENILRTDGDTVNVSFQDLYYDKARALLGLEDYENAARYYAAAVAMNESIQLQTSRQLAQSTIDLLEHKYDLARRGWWMTIAIIMGMVLFGISVMLIVHNRTISHRNRTMSATLNKMLFYRQSAMQNESLDPDETEENKVSDADREELTLFREVDKRITVERLFCNPDFGRDALVRLTGLDKNRLPAFIQKFTELNLTGYINSKRMEYAAEMMKRHPDYTMNAISEACGIKSPATFIRNFKAAFGMAPSDFRKEINGNYPPPIGQFEN